MHSPVNLTRRNFIKGLGAATALPWMSSMASAADTTPPVAAKPHVIVTANIRVALPEDDAAGHGWKARREFCAEVIRAQRPDIICLQEVLREQVVDLRASWPEFDTLGFEGPEMDAHATGYHGIAKNPIFFARDRYELTAAGGFWLSETPQLPGTLSWGSARARNVNWVRLKARDSGREFRVLNTHLDHQSQPAREKQMGLIMQEGALYPVDFPQILAGDLNVDATNPVREIIRQAGWEDTYTAVHGADEPGFTYHDFKGPAYADRKRAKPVGKIDFIFARGKVTAEDAAIIKDSRDGHFPSDHYFVSARVALG